jgi:Zn-dependent peptidase ImmA (M78 family)
MADDISVRVKQVMAASGLSQADFAESVGLDGPKLSKALAGKRRFSSLELALVAEVGGTTVDWLLTGRAPRRLGVAARAVGVAPETLDDIAGDVVARIAERHDALVDLKLPPPAPDLPTAGGGPRYVAAALALAHQALSRFQQLVLRDHDTPSLIGEIEDVLGIDVSVEDLPSGIDGLSYRDGDYRIIVLAVTDRYARQRYTLAHELGHILAGHADETVIAEAMWLRDAADPNRREAFANVFASAFLMPRVELEEVVAGRPVEAVFDELVWRFYVSPETMAWRLFNLNLVDEDLRMRLSHSTTRATAQRLGHIAEYAMRSERACYARPPWRLAKLYLEAYERGDVSLRPVAELLRWDYDRTEEFFGQAGAQSNAD